jgi:hypothetical protein
MVKVVNYYNFFFKFYCHYTLNQSVAPTLIVVLEDFKYCDM